MSTSMNGAFIYQSRYGATQQYANWMGSECKLPVLTPERMDGQVLTSCDFLLLGTPVYTGELLMKDWIRDYKMILQNKKIFLLIVCGTAMSDPQEQARIVQNNLPKDLIPLESIFFLPGRINNEDLSLALPFPRLHEICHYIRRQRS